MRLCPVRQEPELLFVSNKAVTDIFERASSQGFTNDNSNMHRASRNVDFLRQLFAGNDSTRATFLMRSFMFNRHAYT
ncbi:hypothetical protein PWT90_04574 [Aphanocladium album]|nr:hypothetical protein PWT90_04574 [Aphanocladium album]